MKMKQILLRVAMVAIVFAGVAALNRPVLASTCVRGGGCQTNTGSLGQCGGVGNCQCFGFDGSVSNDTVDCSFR